MATLRGHRSAPHTVAYDRTGATLLTCSSDSLILWDARSWSRRRVLPGGSGLVQVRGCAVPLAASAPTRSLPQAAFSPHGGYIVASFRDDSLVAWSAATFDVAAHLTVPSHLARPHFAAFAMSWDDAFLAAGGQSGQICVWDVASQVRLAPSDTGPPCHTRPHWVCSVSRRLCSSSWTSRAPPAASSSWPSSARR